MAEKFETPKQSDDLSTNADLEAFLERAIAAGEAAPDTIPEAVAIAEQHDPSERSGGRWRAV